MTNINQAASGDQQMRRDAATTRHPVGGAVGRRLTRGVRAATPDEAWPPSAVDLHIPAPRRKDRHQCLLRHPRPQHINMKILPLFVLLVCIAWQACAQDDEAPQRPAVSRALLKRGQNPRGKATTTTTPAPQEEVEYEDEAEYEAEDAEPSSEAPPSSTEGKKLVGAGVRPFRSNTDLLETLKKRRQQALEAKSRGHSNSESSAAPEAPVESAKSNYNNKKRAGFSNSPAKETTNEEVPAPAPSKPSRGRFGRPATRSIQPEDGQDSDAPAPPPTPVRSGRAFARRGSI